MLSKIAFSLVLVTILSLPVPAGAADDVVRFDFETGDLQGWQVVSGQFAYLVSDRSGYHNRYPDQPGNKYNKQGRYYLSTVEQRPGLASNDRMTGVVESPVFVLAGPDMSMLVGSGTQPGTYIALCTLDGREVLVARGKAQTEVMQRVQWHAPQLVGQKVFLRAVDRETGSWGHVTFDDFTAPGRIDPDATRQQQAAVANRLARQRLETLLKEFKPQALRAAIRDLTASFPEEYPRGAAFLARLDALEQRLPTAAAATTADMAELARQLETLQREALAGNPLVTRQPILYVWRNQYRLGGHHAIDTLFHTGEINTGCFEGPGALRTVDLKTGRVQTLVDVPDGIARDPEVHFDGRRIVFALRRNIREDYHIWEVNADGSGLRQLTAAEGVSDFDPFYLADDHIAFSSTREPKYNQCSRDIGANLFRMEPDGANIHQIGKNNLFDNHGVLTPDGRILYARWEYVDRNFGDAHGIWTVRPDGTNQALYWGNNTASPGAVYYPRIIAGGDQMLCIFGMHHHRLWGALAIVDPQRGLDGREPVVRTWPAEAIGLVRAGGAFDCDSFVSVYPKYESPYPLSDKYFLCSRMTMRPAQTWLEGDAQHGHEMGLYLVDVFGNEVLLHTDAPGCYDAQPLASQPRPPVIPPQRDFADDTGEFYVADVYRGTHMQGVPRGSVRWLRVVEAPEKRHWSRGAWFGQGYTAPGMNWHSLENKRILGTVPVEADGSAYFRVPAERFVYFQLLDENRMMIHSMRSGAAVQSGERIGCVGCHDERRTAPALGGVAGAESAKPHTTTHAGASKTQPQPPESAKLSPAALRRPPSDLDGWYGPPRLFGYTFEVQPVWDRHCVSCHDFDKPAGQKLVLAGDRSICFNASYEELWRKGFVKCVGAGPAEIQPAYGWGSRVSRLVQELRAPQVAEHKELRLSREELDRIITWVDLNGVYYADYASAYPDSLTGRCPLDNAQLARLTSLTGVPFDRIRSFGSSLGPQISFERPEFSPCLAKLPDHNDARYREALALIRAGGAQLARRPRADMAGFVACETDQRREEKYALRRAAERRNREAIRGGEKLYETTADDR